MDRVKYKQVIVVGGTGQTGHRLIELLIEHGCPKIIATSRSVANGMPTGPLSPTMIEDARRWSERIKWRPLDLEASPEELAGQLAEIKKAMDTELASILIFAAAFTNVDGCETDPGRCERVNERNTIAVLDWARSRAGAQLAFYSTDYVFDGITGPYDEYAGRHAISTYGRSKVHVEEWLERHDPGALIVRTTGVYDYLPGSKNFLMNMLDLWRQGKLTKIPLDQWANPVWARELAQATLELLARGACGIFNVAGSTQLSRIDFARMIAEIFDCDSALISAVRTDELGQKARRPLKGGLKCGKLERELGWAPSGAREVLEEFKRRPR